MENILRTLLKFIKMNEIFYHILIAKERSHGLFDLKFYNNDYKIKQYFASLMGKRYMYFEKK